MYAQIYLPVRVQDKEHIVLSHLLNRFMSVWGRENVTPFCGIIFKEEENLILLRAPTLLPSLV